MPQLAGWIDQAVQAAADGDETTIRRVAAEVTELTAGYPMPGWA
jgi:glycine hydroxymethyltransferase